MQRPEPRSGDIWSLAPVPRHITTSAPLVVLDALDARGRWRAWPVHDAGLLVVAPDIRLPGDAAAPGGEAWCAPREVLAVAPDQLGVRVDTSARPLLDRLRAASIGALPGDARRRVWSEAGDPREHARRDLFALHRAHLDGARRVRSRLVGVARGAALAAAAAILLTWTLSPPDRQATDEPDVSSWRAKGPSAVTTELIRAGRLLPPSATSRSGDVLRVRYSTPRSRLLVASISAAPSILLGDEGGLRITPGNGVLLSWGITLTGQSERLAFLFADRPLTLVDVRRVARGDVPDDLDVETLDVEASP